jgi:hypothetical protein
MLEKEKLQKIVEMHPGGGLTTKNIYVREK